MNTITEDRIRQIFREELIEVLDKLNTIFYRGDVRCDKYGNYYRHEISPRGAILELRDKLEYEETKEND